MRLLAVIVFCVSCFFIVVYCLGSLVVVVAVAIAAVVGAVKISNGSESMMFITLHHLSAALCECSLLVMRIPPQLFCLVIVVQDSKKLGNSWTTES